MKTVGGIRLFGDPKHGSEEVKVYKGYDSRSPKYIIACDEDADMDLDGQLEDPPELLAVKMVPCGLAGAPGELPPVERMRREAKALNKIAGVDNIAHLHRLLQTNNSDGSDRNRYFVLDWVPKGATLNNFVRMACHPCHPSRPGVAKWLLYQLLDTLLRVHEMGVAHRDLKFTNLMVAGGLDYDCRVVQLQLIDFNRALLADDASTPPEQFQRGQLEDFWMAWLTIKRMCADAKKSRDHVLDREAPGAAKRQKLQRWERQKRELEQFERCSLMMRLGTLACWLDSSVLRTLTPAHLTSGVRSSARPYR